MGRRGFASARGGGSLSSREEARPEIRLARELGRAWGDLGGSPRDPAIDLLALALRDLTADPGGRTRAPGRRPRRGNPRR